MNGTPIIELQNVSKTFQTKGGAVHALHDINISVNKGEIFGIIGASGAGKSTLVRCINLLERPTAGEVLFKGNPITNLSRKDLNRCRHSIGMIFQQFNLLMQRNAIENVCFPLEITRKSRKKDGTDAENLRIADRVRARELLEIVGLSDREESYPAQLSGGQKQRVAIARALATNPDVLLCDEATSALDPQTTRSILALLKDINRRLGITVIIITHEMSVIEEICHRVAILDDGGVAEIGRVEDIFVKPNSQAAKRLVYPDGERTVDFKSSAQCLRIVFDGNSSYEPVIANMVLELKHPVNILFADTKNIDGKAFGQIVIQLPDDVRIAARMRGYLAKQNVTVEEVDSLD